MAQCEVCGNETFSDDTVCDDCQVRMPKPTAQSAKPEPKTVEEFIVHKCENCGKSTYMRYGNAWLCDECKTIAKAASGDYNNGNDSKPDIPLETTAATYNPDNFLNLTFEQVYQKIFNDYAVRVSELSDEALLHRIIYHRRAQEIDKIQEGIVLGEKERRLKTRKGTARERLLSGAVPGNKVFPTKSDQEKAEAEAKKSQQTTMSKTEKALKKMVDSGVPEATARQILGL